VTEPKKRRPGEHKKHPSHYGRRPQNRKKSQLERITRDPSYQFRISRLIDEGLSPREAARKEGIGDRAFAQWWKSDRPEAIAFRTRHADSLRRGRRRAVDPAKVLDDVVLQVSAGADLWSAWSVNGVSQRRAKRFLDENEDARQRLAQAGNNRRTALEKLVSGSSDWRAASWLLERLYPETYLSAKAKAELKNLQGKEPIEIAEAIVDALAMIAIRHAHSTKFAREWVGVQEDRIAELAGDEDVLESRELHQLQQTTALVQECIDIEEGRRDVQPLEGEESSFGSTSLFGDEGAAADINPGTTTRIESRIDPADYDVDDDEEIERLLGPGEDEVDDDVEPDA